MSHPIYPCFWFDGKAKDAASFYCSIFKDARIIDDNPIVVNFKVGNQKFMCLNGGPKFSINPSISNFATFDTKEETERVWHKLVEGGQVLMPLDKYPWSEVYGWLQDQFGVSWQVSVGDVSDMGQRYRTSLLFVGEQNGRAEEAMTFYTSIFSGGSIDAIHRYEPGEPDTTGNVKYAEFTINDTVLSAMDSSMDHRFRFSEGVSLVVNCDSQEEIDRYWSQLTEGGREDMCGWLKDKFGVSWQIVPAVLGKLMAEPGRADRVMRAFMKMRKFDIAALEAA